uniref:Sulfotransferase n=1 Tax=Leptobrachium leishanense TaxID=445787 RepID=A0A8C5PRU2_9ANUR
MAEKTFRYRGVPFTTDLHTEESLSYAENEFVVLDDDTFNVTYPKSGTNWMIEILNLIKYNGNAELSNQLPIFIKSPWYELAHGKQQVEVLTSPRIITTHLQYQMFSKSFFNSKAKIVYTMRNPKDVCVSNYHFAKIVHCYKDPESIQEHLETFLQGNDVFGCWFDHVKGWMQMKDDSRFFYISYEELQQDLRGSVVRLCKFLEKELDDEAIDSVVKHSSFQVMKNNKMANWSLTPSDFMDHNKGSIMRKGVSGDWKNHFTVAQNEYFDRVYEEKIKDFNIKLFWEDK